MEQDEDVSIAEASSDPVSQEGQDKEADNSANGTPLESQESPNPSARSARTSNNSRGKAERKINYAEDSDSEDEMPLEAPAPSSQRRTKPAPKRQPIRGNWSADHLMQSEKSKLKDVDLEDVLGHPKAWSTLSQEQQQQLCSMLPQGALPQDVLRSNSTFRSQLRLFQDELAAGRFDPIWLRDAQKAMERRANGDFDKWKETEREKFWGQKQTNDWSVNAGDSAKWSISDLIRGGCFEVGDIWLVKHKTRAKESSIMLEKEATIKAILPNDTLTFSYAPGQHKHSAPSNGQDKELVGASNPNAVMKVMMAEDGRTRSDMRIGNAWRDIRCIRKNQDMGSLWDVRELLHNKQSA